MNGGSRCLAAARHCRVNQAPDSTPGNGLASFFAVFLTGIAEAAEAESEAEDAAAAVEAQGGRRRGRRRGAQVCVRASVEGTTPGCQPSASSYPSVRPMTLASLPPRLLPP